MASVIPHTFVGLDLGKRSDPAAVAIVHRVHEPTGQFDHVTWQPVMRLRYFLSHVERFHLGTPYLTIVEKVRRLLRDLTPGIAKTLLVDAGNAGEPVIELLRQAGLGCRLIPVNITACGHAHWDRVNGYFIPRHALITRLRIAFEGGLLQISRHIHDRDTLIKELTTLTDRSGSHHDDLAISLALAICQQKGVD